MSSAPETVKTCQKCGKSWSFLAIIHAWQQQGEGVIESEEGGVQYYTWTWNCQCQDTLGMEIRF